MSNIRDRFERLIPGRTRTLAKVIANRSDGTVEVESYTGGRYVVASGGNTLAADDNVVIRDDVVIALAPDLPTYSVSV